MIFKKLAPPPFIPVKAMVGAPVRLIIACVAFPWYGIIGGISWLWMITFNPMLEDTRSFETPIYQKAFPIIRGGWMWMKFGISEYEYSRLERLWNHDRDVREARKTHGLADMKDIDNS